MKAGKKHLLTDNVSNTHTFQQLYISHTHLTAQSPLPFSAVKTKKNHLIENEQDRGSTEEIQDHEKHKDEEAVG